MIKRLIAKAKHNIRKQYWNWKYFRRRKCATISKGKNYIYTVDVAGEIGEVLPNGWINYTVKTYSVWCVNNGIYEFDIVETYVSRKDYKMHFIFGFKHIEDATAFKLGLT